MTKEQIEARQQDALASLKGMCCYFIVIIFIGFIMVINISIIIIVCERIYA